MNHFDSKKYNLLALKSSKKYIHNKPFPHIQFKNFLSKKYASKLYKQFPKYNSNIWINHKKFGKNKNVNFKKAQHDERKFPKILRELFRELNSRQFILFLETLTGIDSLIPDPYLIGGGLHLIKKGGYLNIHTDFNWSHKLQLHRRVNVLIYLTPGWKKNNQGTFELYDKKKKRLIKEYVPFFNSCIIFNTSGESFHGHPKPVLGNKLRRVLNLYYYTSNRKKSEIYNPTFTNYGVLKKRKINLKEFNIKNSPFSTELLKKYKKLI